MLVHDVTCFCAFTCCTAPLCPHCSLLLSALCPLQITPTNVELCRVTPEGGYAVYSKAELEAIIKRAAEEAAAEGDR